MCIPMEKHKIDLISRKKILVIYTTLYGVCLSKETGTVNSFYYPEVK